ncbi:MAG: leucine-rich repeat protein [Clostridia bacterium]|nr:leucine-rich repeat protein [Clostridia bacterium]
MKKLLTSLIACALACTVIFAVTACSTPSEPPRVASKGLSFELNDEGTGYIVSSIGTCGDKVVVIPETYNEKPVVAIGDAAFKDKKAITGVDVPGSIKYIGDEGFRGCDLLASVVLAEGVEHLGERCFSSCTRLVSITIPLSMTTMSGLVFTSNTLMTDIYYKGTSIPSGWDSSWKYDNSAFVHYSTCVCEKCA